jgi:ubiquitin carboxyl-terminal hydrolase 34
LEGFFLDFARLALHMLNLDTLALSQLAEEADVQTPEMMSRTYLPSLGWILQISNIPFFRAMERLNHMELANLVARVNDQIASSPVGAMEQLSEFVDWTFSLLPRWPHLAPVLVSALNVAHNMVESGNERRNHGARDDLIDSPVLAQTIKNGYTLFRNVDEKYQAHISKKSSWVTSEISESLLRYIGVAYQAFSLLDRSFVLRLARELSIELPDDVKPEESFPIIHLGWRFGVLKRHIMEGRMELRVFGMESMQSDLVTAWRQHIQGNPEGIEYPIIQYIVNFLRENRIVDYIVGVGSHPQLISRSGNIVGFLVVTSTYTDADTDTIWKAVTESQDQRTVSEVLTMLTRTFIMHPASSTALLYLCSKLIELPLNRFDTRMIEFCDQLLHNVRDKHGERTRHEPLDILHVDSIPLRLCVRLIRESTAFDEFSVEHKTALQKFASVQLSSFLSLGMSEADKLDVYERCIQDIAEMNQFASGSIQALNALLPVYDAHEIRKLTLDFDLTRLMIMEFCHVWQTDQSDFTDSFSKNALLSRIQLLNRIIDKVPETITAELSDTLWTKVFMTEKVGQARAALWDMLCRVTGHCGTPNPFIERCLHEYMPDLSPEKYSPEILAFAEQAVGYEIRFNPPPVPGEGEIISLPGMDRIWHLILTAPPGTIESMATSFAIEIYLDHMLIRRAPSSAAEATHISLVDRCVEQIRSAATRLKSSRDSLTNGEDETMAGVGDEQEIRAAELRFSRSLLFLQQLLQGLRTRPQYSPPQGQAPDLPERLGKGDLLEIPYQCFNGGTQSKVRTLQIGDLCTTAELVDRLVRLTGFSKFSTIYGGQKLNLMENPDATLRDLKFRAGLLIIRKISDGPELSHTGRRQSLTLVDSEVLKYFDDLYDLLSLEDKLAKEVRLPSTFSGHGHSHISDLRLSRCFSTSGTGTRVGEVREQYRTRNVPDEGAVQVAVLCQNSLRVSERRITRSKFGVRLP